MNAVANDVDVVVDTNEPGNGWPTESDAIRDANIEGQEKKCFYCRQDRQRCDWRQGKQKCERCDKMNYTCSVNQISAETDTTRRTLRFEKCSFCRSARQKCLPVDRVLPARCDRCVAKSLPCSEPQKKRTAARALDEITVTIIADPRSSANSEQTLQSSPKRRRITGLSTTDEAATYEEQAHRLFGYGPLSHGKFRLLELHQGSGEDEIVYELHEWDELNSRAYEAISYLRSFDEKVQVKKLSARGILMPTMISPNLLAALRCFRLRDQSRFLWVNALCINHGDVSERNSQVHLVRKIFSSASKVCLWLGNRDGSVDHTTTTAFEFAEKLLDPTFFHRAAKEIKYIENWKAFLELVAHPLFERRWIVQEVAVAPRVSLYCGHQAMDWTDFADVVTLLEHTEKHDRAISCLLRQSRDSARYLLATGEIEALGAIRFIKITGDISTKATVAASIDEKVASLLSLERLVYQLASFKGQSPHDVIFACCSLSQESRGSRLTIAIPLMVVQKAVNRFLSLIHRKIRWQERPAVLSSKLSDHNYTTTSVFQQEESSDAQSERLVDEFLGQVQEGELDRMTYEVNYNVPVIVTYREFIAHVLRKSRSLAIICRPWAPPRFILASFVDGKIPSWINTLERASLGPSSASFGYVRINADPLIGSSSENENYNASLSLPAVWSFPSTALEPHRALHVDGFVLTKIVEISTAAVSGNIPTKWFSLAGWQRQDERRLEAEGRPGTAMGEDLLFQSQSARSVSADNMPPASLWRTLVADRDTSGNFAPNFYKRACHHAFKDIGIAPFISTTDLLVSVDLPSVREYLQRVQRVVWNRQLMMTERGLLGLVPDSARTGDLVCILYGCSVPVIIRELGDGYHELVGEAFVYSMMDGAAINVQIMEKITKTTFKLL